MASAATTGGVEDPGTPAMSSAAATGGMDSSCPYKWKWLVKNDDTNLLSLNHPDLKLGDFLVRVDGRRRLTITDLRKPTPGGNGNGKAPRLKKTTFQLPKTANTDAITGCFHGDVLTLTVPNKGQQQQPPAAVTVPNKGQQQQPPAAVTVAAKKEEEEEEEPRAKAEREKQLIVAAFTLGVLFSHRLFSSRN